MCRDVSRSVTGCLQAGLPLFTASTAPGPAPRPLRSPAGPAHSNVVAAGSVIALPSPPSMKRAHRTARRAGQRPRLLSTGHDLMTSRPPQRSAFLTGQLATFRWTCPPNPPGAATRCLSPRHILPLDHPHQPASAHLSCTTRVLTDLAICRKPRGLPPSKGDHTYVPSV